MKLNLVPGFVCVLLVALAGSAGAHTGHGTESVYAGLAHPFGLDHLLAMVAVGLWSVFALPAGRAWMGPVTFMLALVVGAAVGASGATLPFLEVAISASVVVFGAMLILVPRQIPVGLGLRGVGGQPAWPGPRSGVAGLSGLCGLCRRLPADDSDPAFRWRVGWIVSPTLVCDPRDAGARRVRPGVQRRRRLPAQPVLILQLPEATS
jgi:hypothetical protein